MLKKLLNREEKIAVIGMGYVGFPLAAAFTENGFEVIGFDINSKKIESYKLFLYQSIVSSRPLSIEYFGI